MTQYERSQQLWSLLALASRNRQILTYDMVSRMTGLIRPSIGQMLAPIQDYCIMRKLPPLTILVVQEESGLPGSGFIAAQDIPMAQQNVFAHDWLITGCPSDSDFSEVHQKQNA
jgi:hypothetical protein